MIDREHKEQLLKSRHFCMLPFVHTCVLPDKRVIPCCMNHTYIYGKTDEQSLDEIFSNNNKKLVEFRREILNGPELPPTCHRCNEPEPTVGSETYRSTSNREYGYLLDNLEINIDGTVEQEMLSLWDIRFSNLCNLKCRTCDDISSSKIGEEEHRTDSNIIVLKRAFEEKSEFLDFFKRHIDIVEEIYFCGGEPLLLKEHYEILDILLEHKKFKVKLRYNSNCTTLTLGNKNVLDYWKQFENIHLAASIDAGWEQLEYIRHGSTWSGIVENLTQIKRECPHVGIFLGPTVSILNAFHIAKFHLFLAKNNIVNVNNIYYNLLKYPGYYSIKSFSPNLKNKVSENWQWYISELQSLQCSSGIISEIEKMMRFMYSEDTSNTLPDLKNHIISKDKLRNESFQKTFPELIEIFENE